jgi:hypothetical protein
LSPRSVRDNAESKKQGEKNNRSHHV